MARSKKTTVADKPLRSTAMDFERFMASSIWYDVTVLVKDRLEVLQNQFIVERDVDQIRNIQGQMIAWKEMLGLPGYLKSCATAEQMETNKQDQKEDED